MRYEDCETQYDFMLNRLNHIGNGYDSMSSILDNVEYVVIDLVRIVEILEHRIEELEKRIGEKDD